MKEVWPYFKKLRTITGIKLYMNFVSMMLISSLEGISIVLLFPLLSLSGILAQTTSGSLSYFNWIIQRLNILPSHSYLPLMLVIYVIIVILQAWLQRNQTIVNSQIQQDFMKALRLEVYESLLSANWNFFLRKRNSDLNHLMTTELMLVSQGTQLVLRLATTIIFTLIQIGFALWLSVKLTLFVLIGGLLMALFSRRFIRSAQSLGDRTNELSKSYLGGLSDHFSGMKDTKSNMLEAQHLSWLRVLCTRMEQHYVKFVRLQTTSQFFYKVTSSLLIALFVLFSMQVLHAEAGQLILIVIVFSRLWPKFTSMQGNWEQIGTNIPAFKRLNRVMSETREAAELDPGSPSLSHSMIHLTQSIECRNLFYRYESKSKKYALQNINLHIPVNSMTAIVGKSGAGKSTLIDILTGLIVPESGEILIDNDPVTSQNMISLRRSISYVSQDPFLFHASLRENLLMLNQAASEEELWTALEFAAAADFVRMLPDGLDTIIGDRGIKLSGGERQRIVLARAILKKPSILVLDEATSALDVENEFKIQTALERLKGSVTLIVIAHRLSTIRNADQVIVLEKGHIVQQGGYHQLSGESRGTFNKLLGVQADSRVITFPVK
ncbi:ABC transporter ATP-binding protein [Paenibacillus ihuae]|uniref:ABC transporter ATP-binding protein n=1 Tax=Paenibacillus ihuae TaxID=1232431 RepID=UPI0006D590FB|nr:ABC transporter ATP-binding protein [Paenibacillus ihuae]